MMTEEEYAAFEASGGDKNFLKKFMNLEKGEEIEAWEKASTVYEPDSDDEQVQAATIGELPGKQLAELQVFVDVLCLKWKMYN